jgi:hypothetical protein
MATTPLWVPLLVAVLGLIGTVVGTVAGVIITQRRSDRRETLVWERERERERERWTREDEARTFDIRRESYIAYYSALSVRRSALSAAMRAPGPRNEVKQQISEIDLELRTAYQAVQVYGSDAIRNLAADLYSATSSTYRTLNSIEASGPKIKALVNGAENFLEEIRGELGIPKGVAAEIDYNFRRNP